MKTDLSTHLGKTGLEHVVNDLVSDIFRLDYLFSLAQATSKVVLAQRHRSDMNRDDEEIVQLMNSAGTRQAKTSVL